MPGVPGICVCFRGGARQFEEEREKSRQRSKEGEKRMEKEIAVREPAKLASATVVCCLSTVMCYLHHCSRGVLSVFADRRRGKDMWPTQT